MLAPTHNVPHYSPIKTQSFPSYGLKGLLLDALAPVWFACTADGGGPGGASYAGDGSPAAGLLVGSALHCEGSTFVAPAGGWYVGGGGALGSYIGGGIGCIPYCALSG